MSYKVYETFADDQMEQIRLGLENGLSVEQVAMYAKPEFNPWQMSQIRAGFESGLREGQVAFYARPEFKAYQMQEIRQRLECRDKETKTLREDSGLSL